MTVRGWTPSLIGGVLVLPFGLLEFLVTASNAGLGGWAPDPRMLAVVLGVALAVGLCHRAPGAGLLVAGLTGVLQYGLLIPPMLVEVALFGVIFAAARRGRTATLIAAAVAVPVAALLAVQLVAEVGSIPLPRALVVSQLGEASFRLGTTRWVLAGLLSGLVLLVPWLAGLTARFVDRARDAQAARLEAEEHAAVARQETDQAREIAQLRAAQTRLARDVHDVVGHSLAVILAQAESAQFLPDDEPERLKVTMATIAHSARSSLQDVRQVLTNPASPPVTGDLAQLLDGVRAAGHQVDFTDLGTRRPLAPDLEVTAFRITQEMLTNAVRHGSRTAPIRVERRWPGEISSDGLTLQIANTIAPGHDPAAHSEQGRGLAGMRARAEAIGGRLDIQCPARVGHDGDTFTVTARLPLAPR